MIKCDRILDADNEVPNLPDIVAYRTAARRGNMNMSTATASWGSSPKVAEPDLLHRIYQADDRGLNNIIEMQGLFTHRMIADPGFNQAICCDIEDRIQNTIAITGSPKNGPLQDHLVHSTFYTEDIALC